MIASSNTTLSIQTYIKKKFSVKVTGNVLVVLFHLGGVKPVFLLHVPF